MEIEFQKIIEANINQHFNKESIYNWNPVSGGSINAAYKVTSKTATIFLKTNTNSVFKNGFKEEVHGLKFLERNNAKTPEIIFEGHYKNEVFLALEWIQDNRKTSAFWRNFGEQLANLHKHTAKRFGLDECNYMGKLIQINSGYDKFTDFFVENRLKPQIELAYNRGLLSKVAIVKFETLYRELNALLPVEKPAAVHGDLWSGNYISGPFEKAVFIDPAVYYGHREVDLAMSTLFGGFSEKFYTAYQEVYPLEKGFMQRKDIYNLYPLLIHLNLFGVSYLGSITSIINKF